MKTIAKIISGAAILLTFYGCESVRIISSWDNPDRPAASFRKVMVLALAENEERIVRQDLENHIADDLCNLGYDAVSAYHIYGPKAFEKTDEKTALELLRKDGIEAVLTVVLLRKENSRYYSPTYVYYAPVYQDFWGYRRAIYQRIAQPGYYEDNPSYYWESNLYDMPGQYLLYSVQTKSVDYHTSNEFAHEYGKMIVKDMLKKGVLKKSN